MSDEIDTPTVELYIRSLLPTGTPNSTVSPIREIQSLSASGVVDEASVTVVGKGVVHEDCCLSTPCGSQLLDTLEGVRAWAERNDATVPGVETSTVESSAVREESYTRTTVPQCLLLEYDGRELAFVSPSTVAGTHWSVEDHLSAIADDRPSVGSAVTSVAGPGDPADRTDQAVADRTAQPLDVSHEQ